MHPYVRIQNCYAFKGGGSNFDEFINHVQQKTGFEIPLISYSKPMEKVYLSITGERKIIYTVYLLISARFVQDLSEIQ